MDEQITAREFHASPEARDWRVLGDGACAFYRTASLAEAAGLVRAIAELPGVAGHRPDIDIRPDGVTVRLVTATAEYMGMTRGDVEMAGRISSCARDLGLVADPSAVQSVLLVVESMQPKDVVPFWQAALGYVRRPDSPDEDLVDPHGRGPALWFEPLGDPDAHTRGIHVAAWVAPEEAEARVAAALAAGGRIVRDRFAPAWWTLADAAGNEADIATIQGRD